VTNEELAIKIKRGFLELLPTLWEQVQRLVYIYANRYFTLCGDAFSRAGIEVEDLVQEGYFALLDAVQAYEPERGYKLTTYLKYPLRNQFNGVLGFRSVKGSKDTLLHSMSIDKPTKGTEGITLCDSISDSKAESDMENVLEKEYHRKLHNDLQECLVDLPDNQQEVIESRYRNGNTYQDIADKMGTHDSLVRSMECKALRKLRYDKRLREYREEVMSRAYRGSFSSWVNTRTSSTEKAAVMLSDWDSFVRCQK